MQNEQRATAAAKEPQQHFNEQSQQLPSLAELLELLGKAEELAEEINQQITEIS